MPEETEEVVGNCHDCGRDLHEGADNYSPFTGDYEDYSGEQLICNDCANNYPICPMCDIRTESTEEINGLRNNRYVCRPCAQDNYYRCEDCEQYFTSLHEDSSYACRDCYTCDCGDCSYCGYDSGEESEYVHDYGYKPRPIFHSAEGKSNQAEPGIPYLGLELEIGISDRHSGAELVTEAANGLVYCKEDSSVPGFEMVTHPMTLEAADSLIPWEALRTLRNDYSASAYRHGIHVHVSRSGFKNDVHVFTWMKFIYRNEEAVTRIARRKSEDWARFSLESRIAQRTHAHKVRPTDRAAYGQRYSAINVNNDPTFEVRVFRGSLIKGEVMAALELVHASVEYTRQLTVEAVANGGWTWAAFTAWAAEQGTYGNLLELDAKTAVDGEADKAAQRNTQYLAQARAELERQRKAEAELRARRAAERAEWEAYIAEHAQHAERAIALFADMGYNLDRDFSHDAHERLRMQFNYTQRAVQEWEAKQRDLALIAELEPYRAVAERNMANNYGYRSPLNMDDGHVRRILIDYLNQEQDREIERVRYAAFMDEAREIVLDRYNRDQVAPSTIETYLDSDTLAEAATLWRKAEQERKAAELEAMRQQALQQRIARNEQETLAAEAAAAAETTTSPVIWAV